MLKDEETLTMRKLETGTKGTLYLHSMPGRHEPIADFIEEAGKLGIHRIICLTSDEEIARKSPDYLSTVRSGNIGCKRDVFSVPDFGTPTDEWAFIQLAQSADDSLRNGENILIHCAGGIGRTGMFAGCVLKALGQPLDNLKPTGSWPETEGQVEIVRSVVGRLL